jgi:hypothetical protein
MQNRGTAHLRRGQLSPDERKVRYCRLIVRDGFEYEIPHSLALYLLDGPDKAERLACSSQHPLVSYSGITLIWRESREA